MSYDVIVMGSGFGSAVVARRTVEKGARVLVLVLERGHHRNIDEVG
jgi:choline dehydrogenase-like flavoprotein